MTLARESGTHVANQGRFRFGQAGALHHDRGADLRGVLGGDHVEHGRGHQQARRYVALTCEL